MLTAHLVNHKHKKNKLEMEMAQVFNLSKPTSSTWELDIPEIFSEVPKKRQRKNWFYVLVQKQSWQGCSGARASISNELSCGFWHLTSYPRL